MKFLKLHLDLHLLLHFSLFSLLRKDLLNFINVNRETYGKGLAESVAPDKKENNSDDITRYFEISFNLLFTVINIKMNKQKMDKQKMNEGISLCYSFFYKPE